MASSQHYDPQSETQDRSEIDTVQSAIPTPPPTPLASVVSNMHASIAPPAPVITTHTYWCIRPVCASANIITGATLHRPEELPVQTLALAFILLLSLAMTLVAARRFHARYLKAKGFIQDAQQSISNLRNKLYTPASSASSSGHNHEILSVNTDRMGLACQPSPIVNAPSLIADGSKGLSKSADEEKTATKHSPDQGSFIDTLGSRTCGDNYDEVNLTFVHESSNHSHSVIANKDKPSSEGMPTPAIIHSAPSEVTGDGDDANPAPVVADPGSTTSAHLLSEIERVGGTSPNTDALATEPDWDDVTAATIRQRCERAWEMMTRGEVPSRRGRKALKHFERVTGQEYCQL